MIKGLPSIAVEHDIEGVLNNAASNIKETLMCNGMREAEFLQVPMGSRSSDYGGELVLVNKGAVELTERTKFPISGRVFLFNDGLYTVTRGLCSRVEGGSLLTPEIFLVYDTREERVLNYILYGRKALDMVREHYHGS